MLDKAGENDPLLYIPFPFVVNRERKKGLKNAPIARLFFSCALVISVLASRLYGLIFVIVEYTILNSTSEAIGYITDNVPITPKAFLGCDALMSSKTIQKAPGFKTHQPPFIYLKIANNLF